MQKQLAPAHAPTSDSGMTRSLQASREAEIVEAALRCFRQFGMQKTTLQDVADAAGLSRATVYRYFPDRAVLITAAIDRATNDMYTRASAAASRAKTLESQVAAFVEVQVQAGVEQRARQRIRAHDTDEVFVEAYLQRADEAARTRMKFLEPYVQAARDRGELRKDISVDEACEWISIAMFSMIFWPSGQFFDADDPKSVSRFFARRVCRGLLT
jgi:AcrR family transcriptional regulator